jgi:hypothetical protein
LERLTVPEVEKINGPSVYPEIISSFLAKSGLLALKRALSLARLMMCDPPRLH